MKQPKNNLPLFFTRYWLDILILVSLMVITAGFFVIIRRPPPMSDPTDYFYTAQYTSWVEPTHRHLRYGLMWPLWVLQQVFGYSELSYYALPFLGLLLLVIGTFLVGRVLFNRLVGFASAIFIFTLPVVVEQGSLLLPDFLAPGLFTLGLSILLFLGKRRVFENQTPGLSTRTLLVFSGLLFGWSYLTREYILVLFPVIAYLFVMHKSKLGNIIWFGASFFMLFIAETIWNFIWYGNPLIRFAVSSTPRDSDRIVTDLWQIISQLPQFFFEQPGGWVFTLLLLFATAGCLWMWKRNKERWGAIALWFVGGWLFFTGVALLPILFFDGKFTLLRTNVDRYWVMIFPPMLVAGWGTLYELIRNKLNALAPVQRTSAYSILVIFLFSVSLLGVNSALHTFR